MLSWSLQITIYLYSRHSRHETEKVWKSPLGLDCLDHAWILPGAACGGDSGPSPVLGWRGGYKGFLTNSERAKSWYLQIIYIIKTHTQTYTWTHIYIYIYIWNIYIWYIYIWYIYMIYIYIWYIYIWYIYIYDIYIYHISIYLHIYIYDTYIYIWYL